MPATYPSRPRRLSRSARSGGGRGYPSPSDGRLRGAVRARRPEARSVWVPGENQPGEGRVQSLRVLGPQPHGVSSGDFFTFSDSVNEIKDCSIRLPAQALRPVLISAKIQLAIKPSKAERDAACSAALGASPRVQPVRPPHSPALSALRSGRLNPGRGACHDRSEEEECPLIHTSLVQRALDGGVPRVASCSERPRLRC